MKTLRTDRGGELASNQFSQFCKDNGIHRQLTAAYTPQQNGVAERKNRVIVEKARCLLKSKGLPKYLWVEAVATSIYLLNIFPTKLVNRMTPFQAWFGFKPDVSHLKIFGSIAYAHVLAEKRKKLDDKSRKLIFVGYSKETKGYRLFDPITKKLDVSRDVVFDENNSM